MNIKNDEIINTLLTLHDKIYLVGGAVRDIFLNKSNYDKDVIVDGIDAKEFALKVAQKFDATLVPLDEENKIYRVVLSDKVNYIDITNPIENSLTADLKRRDLTINAIAINCQTEEIIDIVGGVEDLKNKKIRAISEQNFIDDPLRILRAYRFQATLGFDLEDELKNIIERNINLIQKPAIERINYEIMKLFDGKYTDKALLEMEKSGLLEKIFPVVADVKKVPQNLHHHLDLFHHSVESVFQIQQIYENSAYEVRAHLESIDFGGFSRLSHLKLAGFLHDIGKFSTWTIENVDGIERHRFIKHDDVGAKMIKSVLRNFSKKQLEYIEKMVKFHIYPSHVVCAPNLNDKIYMRYIRKMEDDVIDNITLAKADRLSARGVEITDEIVNQNISALDKLQEYYIGIKDSLEPLPKLIDGHEVMELTGLKPSPELGRIMQAIQEAQINCEIQTKEDAIKLIKLFNY